MDTGRVIPLDAAAQSVDRSGHEIPVPTRGEVFRDLGEVAKPTRPEPDESNGGKIGAEQE